mmetsp:Transcript_32313/g.58411  ORF Transcript_32313/g.58411 Transcript_32313/m.58411 type:complete len:95 (-) Transcript_32313:3481-3765(-)
MQKGRRRRSLWPRSMHKAVKIGRQCKELAILNTKNQGINVKEKENMFLKAKIDTLNAKVRVQNGTLATLHSKVQSDSSKEQEDRILRAKMEEHS